MVTLIPSQASPPSKRVRLRVLYFEESMQKYGGNQADSTDSDTDTHHTCRHSHLAPQSTQVLLLGMEATEWIVPFYAYRK